jgi:hypothetical protein
MRRRKTANWIPATGGKHGPNRHTKVATIGHFRLSSERRYPGKKEGHRKSYSPALSHYMLSVGHRKLCRRLTLMSLCQGAQQLKLDK